MSADRHLARMQRLQRIHRLLLRRQAGALAEVQAATLAAAGRLRRIDALLQETGVAPGAQQRALLAGGAQLRALLLLAAAEEQRRTDALEQQRQAAIKARQQMENRAERIAARVAAARKTAIAGAEAPGTPIPATPIARNAQ